MKFIIKHESRGRMRVQLCQSRMTLAQADLLQAWLHAQPHVLQADVHERTCCAVVTFLGDCREQLISSLRRFSYSDKAVQAFSGIQSGRAINRAYQEKLVGLVCAKAARARHAQRKHRNEHDHHYNGLHKVRCAFRQKAAEQSVYKHECRANEHHCDIRRAEQR